MKPFPLVIDLQLSNLKLGRSRLILFGYRPAWTMLGLNQRLGSGFGRKRGTGCPLHAPREYNWGVLPLFALV
ncbi:hypothetical protein TNCV_2386991 [Trichonephila clavipes]|nr:hypothetical protein TNCV_2386991 [Trichonephila clavipes]